MSEHRWLESAESGTVCQKCGVSYFTYRSHLKCIGSEKCCDCKKDIPESELSGTDWGKMCGKCESEINRQNQGA